jgi:alkylation response protein AidB-like acyl-CoA dehydrogenase
MFGAGIPIAAGQFAPKGTATPSEGGFRINGQYQFGSGINHAQWAGAGLMTEGDAPEYRLAIAPVDTAQITGNWDVLGLQSTASYDYHFDDVFVPGGATFDFFAPERRRGGPVYDLGVLVITASGHAGFAIGLIRRALDELRIKAAGGHQRMAGRTPLAESERLQYDLAVLESRFRAAELWVRDAFARAEQSAIDGAPDPAAMLEARQATTFITQEGGDIIRQAYLHAGTVGLREGALNRCFRDIHAGTQHAVVSPMATLDFGAHLIATAPTPDADPS